LEKIMKSIVLASALFAAIAAPAFAAGNATDHAAFAQAQFNQSYDSVSDIRAIPTGDQGVTASSSNTNIAFAVAKFNASADGTGDLRGLGTVFSGEVAYGAEIFEALRLESLGDE
jgi:hypothetical protein